MNWFWIHPVTRSYKLTAGNRCIPLGSPTATGNRREQMLSTRQSLSPLFSTFIYFTLTLIAKCWLYLWYFTFLSQLKSQNFCFNFEISNILGTFFKKKKDPILIFSSLFLWPCKFFKKLKKNSSKNLVTLLPVLSNIKAFMQRNSSRVTWRFANSWGMNCSPRHRSSIGDFLICSLMKKIHIWFWSKPTTGEVVLIVPKMLGWWCDSTYWLRIRLGAKYKYSLVTFWKERHPREKIIRFIHEYWIRVIWSSMWRLRNPLKGDENPISVNSQTFTTACLLPDDVFS